MIFKTFKTPILYKNMKTGPLSYPDLRETGSRTPLHMDLGLLYILDSLSVNLTKNTRRQFLYQNNYDNNRSL